MSISFSINNVPNPEMLIFVGMFSKPAAKVPYIFGLIELCKTIDGPLIINKTFIISIKSANFFYCY